MTVAIACKRTPLLAVPTLAAELPRTAFSTIVPRMGAKIRSVLHSHHQQKPALIPEPVLSLAKQTLASVQTVNRPTVPNALHILVADPARIAPRLTVPDLDVLLVTAFMLHLHAPTNSVAPSPARLVLAILPKPDAQEANAASAINIPTAQPTLNALKPPVKEADAPM